MKTPETPPHWRSPRVTVQRQIWAMKWPHLNGRNVPAGESEFTTQDSPTWVGGARGRFEGWQLPPWPRQPGPGLLSLSGAAGDAVQSMQPRQKTILSPRVSLEDLFCHAQLFSFKHRFPSPPLEVFQS